MYRQFFGLTHAPLGKENRVLWDNDQLKALAQQFNWLLRSPGIGLLTAAPGVGKTAALRHITHALNPQEYRIFYMAETDFGRLDFYRHIALLLGLEPPYRRAQCWRAIKEHIAFLATQKNSLPVFIIDEAQNLPLAFFRDFPAFLNFAFDSKDYMTVWLVGHPSLAREIDKPSNLALASRIQARCELHPIVECEAFAALLTHGFTAAGCTQRLLSDSAIELLRMATQGNIRQIHQLLITALQLATDKGISHLPDDIIQEALAFYKRRG